MMQLIESFDSKLIKRIGDRRYRLGSALRIFDGHDTFSQTMPGSNK